MRVSAKSPNHADRRIGQRIRLQRLNLGMSQDNLAEALGLTFQQIQKYEKGTNRVSAGRLEGIARMLKVPVAFFYDEADGSAPIPIVPDTPQSLSLLRAFQAIGHPALRKQALELVRAIAGISAGQEAD